MRIAVIVPCYNEEQTIGKVVSDFRRELPEAAIYVGDNNSTDGTAQAAADAGATVIPVYRQGKGAVARALYREVDADLYVMVDGDDTYPAESVHKLIEPVRAGRADMAVGDRRMGGRLSRPEPAAISQLRQRPGHAQHQPAVSLPAERYHVRVSRMQPLVCAQPDHPQRRI